MTLNGKKLQQFAAQKENHALAQEHRRLQAEAARLRIEIDNLYRPIFAQYTFLDHSGKTLTYDEGRLYTCPDDELVGQYFAAIDAAVQEQDYGLQPGMCPALTAEHAINKHRWKIVEAMSKLIEAEPPADPKLQDRMVELFLKSIDEAIAEKAPAANS